MNIYLITRKDCASYDEYDSAVVIANSEIEAAKTHPNGVFWIKNEWCKDVHSTYDWGDWVNPKDVLVKLIGTGKGPRRVVCASFNAG